MPTSTLTQAVATTPLTTSFVTLYTVPALDTLTVAVLHLANTDPATRTCRVCVVPAAGTASAANAVLWDFPLAGADVLELLRGDVWPAGTFLAASGDMAGAMTLRLAGVVTSP